jgi:hypothetical protein
MAGFIGSSITVTLNYNQLQEFTFGDCLRLTAVPPELGVSSLHCDWFGSDLRVGHFFSFRCPLVDTPQLSTQSRLQSDWLLVDEVITNQLRALFISWCGPKTEHSLEQFVYSSVSSVVTVTCVSPAATNPLCLKSAYRTVAQQCTIPAFRLSDTLVVREACLAKRCLAMDYSGFQASFHNMCSITSTYR